MRGQRQLLSFPGSCWKSEV